MQRGARGASCTGAQALVAANELKEANSMPTTPAASPAESSLTAYVADFVVSTQAQDIPPDVEHHGGRSVLTVWGWRSLVPRASTR